MQINQYNVNRLPTSIGPLVSYQCSMAKGQGAMKGVTTNVMFAIVTQ